MSKQKLELIEGNDPVLAYTLQDVTGTTTTAVNLTGATVEMYLKTDPGQADADAVKKATGGQGITITDAAAGKIEVQLFATNFAGKRAYHLDVIKNNNRLTYAYGPIEVIDV